LQTLLVERHFAPYVSDPDALQMLAQQSRRSMDDALA